MEKPHGAAERIRDSTAGLTCRAEDGEGRLALLALHQPAPGQGVRGGGPPRRARPQPGHAPECGVQLRGGRGPRAGAALLDARAVRLRRARRRLRARLGRRAARAAARRRQPGGGVAGPRRGLRQDRGPALRCADLLPPLRRAPGRGLAAAAARLPARRGADLLRRAAHRQTSPPARRPAARHRRRGPSGLRALALLPVDYGVFCAVFLLLGGPELFRAAYAALFVCYALFAVAFGVKWFRELSRG